MRRNAFLASITIGVMLQISITSTFAIEGSKARTFVGQDLHLSGPELVSYQQADGEHVLVFDTGFSMSIGTNRYSCDSAVVWLRSITGSDGRFSSYDAKAYLENNITIKKGKEAATTGLSETEIEQGLSMMVRFDVSGEVFVTAEKRNVADPRGSPLYSRALPGAGPVVPDFYIQPEARVPGWPPEGTGPQVTPQVQVAKKKGKKPGFFKRLFGKKKKPGEPGKGIVTAEPDGPGIVGITTVDGEPVDKGEPKEPKFQYPVHLSPATDEPLMADETEGPNGMRIATVMQRVYFWQKQDEGGGLLELEADNAVVFRTTTATEANEADSQNDPSAGGGITAVYLSGAVEITDGPRTIRADEIYYDFVSKKALIINAEMRSFDVSRVTPIYVRAAKLRQLAENKFAAENATVTTSEFHLPQIWLNVSSINITDTTPVDERGNKLSNDSYNAEMRDIRLKLHNRTVFYWPSFRGNLERPDIPIKSVHAGYDSQWGTLLETRWYLAKLLGLREPEGTESTLALDYYSKRGTGAGAEIVYARKNYFGRMLGYIINDTGEDDLGRNDNRRNLKPPRPLRGRFRWQHRHFLAYDWQLTSEVSYASDENFLEGFYRSEFDVGKEQETVLHAKNIQNNWGISILTKFRINNFNDKLEELPTVEYHRTGESLFGDRFTLYSDTQVSRFRNRYGSDNTHITDQQFYTFISQRTELDLPLKVGAAKVVPFIAANYGYEDQRGFRTAIDGTPAGPDKDILIGEGGVRTSLRPFWKVYPNVKSRLWDLNRLRHIVRPYATAVSYAHSDPTAEQRNVVNVGVSQRLQTKRGPAGEQKTVDWMRLDLEVTWVNNPGTTMSGPSRFIWNKPFIPLVDTSTGAISPIDRRSTDLYGPVRNYFSADYIWRASDTTAILSDMNFDMKSGVVQQFNIGMSKLVWPSLSYYIGSRYLRRVEVGDEKGSNTFTFAATYVLDPRYTLVFSQQFDFDYGANVRSDVTLIRRYHRLYYGLTYSADESLKKQAVVLSIWPQGVPELAIGPRRYMGLTDFVTY